MSRVRVTFFVDVTDPEDSTGLTEADYEDLTERIIDAGGDNITIELVSE